MTLEKASDWVDLVSSTTIPICSAISGGIDHVDILIDHAVQQGGKAADGQRGAVVMGDVAGKAEGDLFQVGVDQLDAEIADDAHQVEERPHLVHQGQVEAGDVDGVFQRLVIQIVDDLPGNIDGHIDLRLEGVGAQMRGDHQRSRGRSAV